MQVHKKDDWDTEGKRIASEANRRYILTDAVTRGGSRGDSVGNKGPAAATGEAKGVNGEMVRR